MIKTTLVILGLIASSTAISCSNNPFAAALNITVRSSPYVSEDLKFCKFLSRQGNCCAPSVIQKIQENVETALNTLQTKAGERDKIIAPAFKNINDNLNDMLGFYKQIAGLNFMKQQSGSTEGLESFENFETDFKKELTSIQKEFEIYQTERKKCFEEVIDIRASSYCMACDPNWESKGIGSNGAITFSNEGKLRFAGACYSFVTKSANLAQIIFMEKYTKFMKEQAAKMSEFLVKFDKVFATAKDDPTALLNFFNDPSNSFGLSANNLGSSFNVDMGTMTDSSLSVSDPISKGVEIPASCQSASNCDFFASNFMKNGGDLEFDTVLIGGQAKDTMKLNFKTGERFGSNRRLLRFVEEQFFNNDPRVLATSGSWNPERSESGVSVTVAADPANQAEIAKNFRNSAARLMAGIVGFVVMALAFMF